MIQETSLPPPATRRRSRVRRIVFVLAALVALWGVVAVWLLVTAARSAAEARDVAEAARAELTLGALLDEGGDARLRRAQSLLRRADSRANSPLLAPLELLPFGGRQLRSFGALASASSDALGIGLDALDRAHRLVASGVPAGSERVEMLQRLQVLLGDARDDIHDLDLGPEQALVGPLADARGSLGDQVGDIGEALARGQQITEGLRRLLDGSRYLVLVNNNAEMRAGSGMVLQVGTLRAEDGELTLEEMESSGGLAVPPGAVQVAGDLGDRWGFLQPADIRNVNLSPRFDRSAELAVELWRAAGGAPVDGVLALDPFSLAAVLEATGPVEAGDEVVGADTVLDLLLHDQYLGDAGDDPDRYEQLGAIAQASLSALSSSDVDAAILAEELAAAARGRHILAWSSDPEMQQAWEAADIDGALDVTSLLVSVINRGANKLDYFVEVGATIEVDERPDAYGVTVRVEVENRVEEGEPQYVAGPNRGLPLAYGEYRGFVALTIPGPAVDGRVDGVDRLAVAGPDGPTRVLATRIRLRPGERAEVVFRFDLPPEADLIRVEPSARAWPVTFRFGDEEWEDEAPRDLELG